MFLNSNNNRNGQATKIRSFYLSVYLPISLSLSTYICIYIYKASFGN